MPAVGKGIYTIPGGYYLNREVSQQVYRKAFMFTTHGSDKRALAAAKAESEFFDQHKQLIANVLAQIEGKEPTDAELREIVERHAGRKPSKAKGSRK